MSPPHTIYSGQNVSLNIWSKKLKLFSAHFTVYSPIESTNKYAIYAYTHGPVTGSGPSVKPLKYDVAPYWLS